MRIKTINNVPIHFPENFRFDCICCGRCCRGWSVFVTDDEEKALKKDSRWKKILAEINGVDPFSGNYTYNGCLTHKDDNSCIMLEDDNRCVIHRIAGFDLKPSKCRLFPFIPVVTPDGIYIGLSFLCPSIRDNRGRDVSEFRDVVEKWLEKESFKLPDDFRVSVYNGLSVNWAGYIEFEKYILSVINTADADSFPGVFQGVLALVRDFCLEYMPEEGKERELSAEEVRKFLKGHTFDLNDREAEESLKSAYFETVIKPLGKIPACFENEYAPGHSGGSQLNTAPAPIEEFRQYISHFLWRKYITCEYGGLYSGMAVLWFVYKNFIFYLSEKAEAEGRAEPNVEDELFAIDLVEFNFGGFSTAYEEVVMEFCSRVVEI